MCKFGEIYKVMVLPVVLPSPKIKGSFIAATLAFIKGICG